MKKLEKNEKDVRVMDNLIEGEVRIMVEQEELPIPLTLEELQFLLFVHEDLFLSDTIEELKELELKIEGVTKGHLLDVIQAIWIDDRTKENKKKREVAKRLYSKLHCATKEQIYHIRKTLIENRSFLETFRLGEFFSY